MARPRPRRPRGFTLAELLVVIAIVALLISILLPALAKARSSSRAAVSASNLRGLSGAMAGYANEFRDQLLNPFDAQNDQRFAGRVRWCDVADPVSGNSAAAQIWRVEYDDPLRCTEMYACFASSFLLGWVNHYDYGSEATAAPADAALLARFRAADPNPPGAPPRVWDSSYWYPPVFWLSQRRYRSGAFEPVGMGGSGLLERHRYDRVTWPSAKALFFERADFTAGRRRGPAGEQVRLPPTFNAPGSSPQAAWVDGSVSRAGVDALAAKAAADPGSGLVPCGDWHPPAPLLQRHDLHGDGLQAGGQEGGPFPAYLWATRLGVGGRDLAR